MKGICPKCLVNKKLTKHHIYPKRYKKRGNKDVKYLCRSCHDELEVDIMLQEIKSKSLPLDKKEYLQILNEFLR